jgi:hypothetical protein
MQRVPKIVVTFSIVGFDPETDSLGVAVQSKFLAVGSVVPWARAGVGAVATQAMANYNYGPHGLELMARGKTADETVEGLTFADEDREHRQVGAVDARGRAATFTGSECFEWAGGATGEHYAAQGNILVGGDRPRHKLCNTWVEGGICVADKSGDQIFISLTPMRFTSYRGSRRAMIFCHRYSAYTSHI